MWWLLCLYCILQLQINSEHCNAYWSGEGFKHWKNPAKFSKNVQAAEKWWTVSVPGDQKTLIKHCTHQCFEQVNYGSNQNSRTYVFLKHKIFLSDSSKGVILGAYVLNTSSIRPAANFQPPVQRWTDISDLQMKYLLIPALMASFWSTLICSLSQTSHVKLYFWTVFSIKINRQNQLRKGSDTASYINRSESLSNLFYHSCFVWGFFSPSYPSNKASFTRWAVRIMGQI